MSDRDEDNVVSLSEFRVKRDASEYRLSEDLEDLFQDFATEDLIAIQEILQGLSGLDEREKTIEPLEFVRFEVGLRCLTDIFNGTMFSTECVSKSDEVYQSLESINEQLVNLQMWANKWRDDNNA